MNQFAFVSPLNIWKPGFPGGLSEIVYLNLHEIRANFGGDTFEGFSYSMFSY